MSGTGQGLTNDLINVDTELRKEQRNTGLCLALPLIHFQPMSTLRNMEMLKSGLSWGGLLTIC